MLHSTSLHWHLLILKASLLLLPIHLLALLISLSPALSASLFHMSSFSHPLTRTIQFNVCNKMHHIVFNLRIFPLNGWNLITDTKISWSHATFWWYIPAVTKLFTLWTPKNCFMNFYKRISSEYYIHWVWLCVGWLLQAPSNTSKSKSKSTLSNGYYFLFVCCTERN